MSIDLRGMASQMAAIQKAAPELEKLKKATDGFEAVFLKKLFSQMRASVKETQFGQTFGKEIYDDMFNEALANAAAKSKTLGMGEMLYKQFAPRVVASAAGSLGLKAEPPKDLKTEPGLEGQATRRQDVDATTQGKL